MLNKKIQDAIKSTIVIQNKGSEKFAAEKCEDITQDISCKFAEWVSHNGLVHFIDGWKGDWDNKENVLVAKSTKELFKIFLDEKNNQVI